MNLLKIRVLVSHVGEFRQTDATIGVDVALMKPSCLEDALVADSQRVEHGRTGIWLGGLLVHSHSYM